MPRRIGNLGPLEGAETFDPVAKARFAFLRTEN